MSSQPSLGEYKGLHRVAELVKEAYMAEKDLMSLGPELPFGAPGFMSHNRKKIELERKVKQGEEAKELICRYSDRAKTRK